MSKVYADVVRVLTEKLYNQLRWAIREYLQNSYDGIRVAQREGLHEKDFSVRIEITKNGKDIIISDNGIGMDEDTLRNYTSIGGGDKFDINADLAGQMGIGKLSGLRFFDKFAVITKKYGSTSAWKLQWDAGGMYKAMKDDRKMAKKTEYSEFIEKFCEVSEEPNQVVEDHYTHVQLLNIHDEFRKELQFDLIVNYIKSNMPVRYEGFRHSDQIEVYLGNKFYNIKTEINSDGEDIEIVQYLNDDLAPLHGFVPPIFHDLKYDGRIHAKIWFTWPYGHTGEVENEEIKGIRYRLKGLIVGDNTLFKKTCANWSDWFIGEVIILSEDIETNAARNDLMEGAAKTKFTSELKKQIGNAFIQRLANVRSLIGNTRKELESYDIFKKKNKDVERALERLVVFQKKLKTDAKKNNYMLDKEIEHLVDTIENILRQEEQQSTNWLVKDVASDSNANIDYSNINDLLNNMVRCHDKIKSKATSPRAKRKFEQEYKKIKESIAKKTDDIVSSKSANDLTLTRFVEVIEKLLEYLEVKYDEKKVVEFIKHELKSR